MDLNTAELLCQDHKAKAIVKCRNCTQNYYLCVECLADHAANHTYESADLEKKAKALKEKQ